MYPARKCMTLHRSGPLFLLLQMPAPRSCATVSACVSVRTQPLGVYSQTPSVKHPDTQHNDTRDRQAEDHECDDAALDVLAAPFALAVSMATHAVHGKQNSQEEAAQNHP
eukprot:GHVU01019934.1.p1 GENE.GHVU01019934.1~~GHVU01019934.1.p1  ORF type:complete len:110 (-),score=4.47 GHVU01019934.1:112-441(-)